MKKKLIIIFMMLFVITGCSNKLPKPEITTGLRGQFGIDKNINEETIDKYLNREDTVYRDMRMYEDPADYEAIGGDSFISGFVKGFEAVPFPLLVNVTNLPEEVGKTYEGDTLFTFDEKEYTANYEESLEFLEYHFPKDKYIFLMCGGGGYAGMTKDMLISLGWDKDKIYNVGAYWSYNGNNKVEVKKEVDNEVFYDFWKIKYIDINFDHFRKI